MNDHTLIIEYADIAIEEVIIYHKSDDKRYRKLKGNKTFWRDLDKVMHHFIKISPEGLVTFKLSVTFVVAFVVDYHLLNSDIGIFYNECMIIHLTKIIPNYQI